MRRAVVAAVAALTTAAGAAAAVSSPEVRAGTLRLSGTPVATVPGYGAAGTSIVDYRHGAVLRLSMPVTNTGRVPVTVRATALDHGPLALLTLRRSPSVRVPPGQTRAVAVEAELGNCKYFHERETQSYDGLEVAVSALGRTSVRDLRFARPLLVHSPMIVGCPDRLLDRQANDRGSASS